MDLLSEWLGNLIEQELGQALACRVLDSNQPPSTSRKGGCIFEDDGEELRVQASKSGVLRVLQIIKWLEFDRHPKAILSDSFSQVHVSFATTAIQSYEEEHKRRLSEGTLGGFFKLIDFEIVATHKGPRLDRVVLFVKSFKSLGSNGSGQVGVAPHSVTSREVVKEHLKKLTMLRDQEATSNYSLSKPKYSSEAPSFESQPGYASSGEETQPASQVFATQAPFPKRSAAGVSKVGASCEAVNVGSTLNGGGGRPSDIMLTPVASNNKITKPTNSSTTAKHPLREQIKPYAPTANGKRISSNQADSLLSLLPQQKKVPIPKAVSSEPPKVLARACVLDTSSKLAPEQNAARLQDSDSDVDDFTGQLVIPKTVTSTQPATIIATEPCVDLVSMIPAKEKSPRPIQYDARTRISSRDVRITKDQETLLNCEDSWIPAEPGHREPAANVPISILQTMNRDADLRVPRSQWSRKSNRKVTDAGQLTTSPRESLQSTGNNSRNDSESEIPAAEWPESPERDRLPPDSSMESAVHSNHSPQYRSPQITSGVQSRRPSHASIPSKPASSSRLSPILSTAPLVNVKESSPEPVSPRLGSPSIISTSAGEETYVYTCREVGCSHSYKKAGGLKQHMDRRHSNRSIQIFKCTVQNCNQSYTSPEGLKVHTESRHSGKQPRANQDQSDTADSCASTPVLPAMMSAEPHGTKSKIGLGHDHEDHLRDEDIGSSTTSIAGTAPSRPDCHTLPGENSESMEQDMNTTQTLQPQSFLDNGSFLVKPARTLPNKAQKPYVQTTSTHSRSASPQSDMEMTLPRPLHENKDLHVNSAPQQRSPSTASQPDAPFTQVKRTPYINGQLQGYSTQSSIPQSSPSKWQGSQPLGGTMFEDTTHVSASLLSTQLRSSADVASAATTHPLTNSHVGEDNELPKEGDDSVSAPTAPANVDPQSRTDSIQDHAKDQNTKADVGGSPGQDHGLGAPNAISLGNGRETSGSPSRISKSKRKASDPGFLSPNVANRRKKLKVSSIFDFTENFEDRPDPLKGARHSRREFMESRRSSERITPIPSPTRSSASPPKNVQPSTEAPALVTLNTQLVAQDQSKAAESHAKQTIIDLEMSSGIHEEESMAVIEKATASANPNGDIDEDVVAPTLEEGTQYQIIDGEREKSSVGATDSDVNMLDADVQSTTAPIDMDTIISTVQAPSTQPKFDVKDTIPAAHDDESTHLLDDVSGTGLLIIESERLVHEETKIDSSKEFILHQKESIKHDLKPQVLDHQELPAHSPSALASQSLVADQTNDWSTSLASLPLMMDVEDPMPDVQEEQNLDPWVKANSTRPSLLDESPRAQQDVPALVNEPVSIDQALPFVNATRTASLNVLATDRNASNHPPKSASTEHVESVATPAPANIFARFKETYPSYSGDMKHLVAICRKISSLCQSNRMEHQSLWDDFIIRHKVEYAQYLRQCAEDAEDPLPYEDFYRNEIEEPKYRSRVVTRKSLDEVLSLINQAPKLREEQKVGARNELCRPEISNSKPQARSKTPAATPTKSSKARVTIDLTEDDQGSGSRPITQSTSDQFLMNSRKKVSRSIPWREPYPGQDSPGIAGAVTSANATPLGQRKDSSLLGVDVSRSQGSNLVRFQNSHASDTSDTESVSVLIASGRLGGPTKTKAERRRDQMIEYEKIIRSSWGIGPHDVLEQKYVDKMDKRQMQHLADISRNVALEKGRQLLLERIHGRIASNPTGAMLRLTIEDLRIVKELTWNFNLPRPGMPSIEVAHSQQPRHSGKSPSTPSPDPYGIRIQEAWGVEPGNVLEREHYSPRAITPRLKQLLAEIAEIVDIHEARAMIKAEIEKRKSREAQVSVLRDATKILTTADLEAVRDELSSRKAVNSGRQKRSVGAKKVRGLSTADPLSLPPIKTADEFQDESKVKEWWQDANAPFKTFARAYASIQPGRGNSYAESETVRRGSVERVEQVQKQIIDILSWSL